jgi:hypothetical protein
MNRSVLAAAIAALIGVCACGQSADEKQAQQAQKQVEQAAKTTEQAAQQTAKGLEDMAKGLQALAGGGGDVKAVQPVDFHTLQGVFPDLSGWDKEKATGERMSSPFAYSQASVRYKKNDSSIELKIIDSGFNQLLLTPYAMFLQAGYEKETSDGYEKSTKVNDQPGWEKWNSESKDGELNALVGKRFLVTMEGRELADTKVLHELAGKMDMGKLAGLK